jgi:hypothetical protein
MLGKKQFSFGYVMLEIFWVAVALGFFRAAFSPPLEPYDASSLFLFVGIAAAGAAFGGLFGRMVIGAIAAVAIALLLGLLLPAVMVA